MMAERRQTFSVFVRRGNKRLMLRRYVPDLERARAYAEAMRRDRFHDPEAVIIVDDLTRATVSEPPAKRAQSLPGAPPAPVLQALEPRRAARGRPVEPRSSAAGQVRATRPDGSHRHLVRALHGAMLSQAVVTRARARLDRAVEGAVDVPARVEALLETARVLQEQHLGAILALERTVRALGCDVEPGLGT